MRPRRSSSLIVVAAAATLLVLAPPGIAKKPKYRVGIGDQHAGMFVNPAFQALGIKRIRYITPWDTATDPAQLAEVDAYLKWARLFKKDVLVTFTARRGCFLANGRYSKAKSCRAPSAKSYRKAFKRFRELYPWVKTYSPWNEANHVSQPTYKKPGLAVRYFKEVRRACKKCRIVALDVLDIGNMKKYVRSFVRKTRRIKTRKPRIWGLHNYGDVNRQRTRMTRQMLRLVKGQVWMTETGGVVAFGDSFPYDEQRAARRTRTMFKLADKFSKRRKGYRSRITRVYPYKWTGVPEGARFDAGLTNPDGSPRPALAVFESIVKRRLK